ncbi:hypothetical protein GOODEAATRI_016253 [Goodea atripinnis]|uniref:BTB domain-containing protein n=1 Tax=Goodea atripinnis TaxID=208336 RepID=A0ABV0P4K3_9TELE
MASKVNQPSSDRTVSSNRTVSTCHTGAKPDHLSGLVKSMDEMRKRGALCDVTLVVQERRFSVHRLVLAAGSEFFRLMFTSMQDMFETSSFTATPYCQKNSHVCVHTHEFD